MPACSPEHQKPDGWISSRHSFDITSWTEEKESEDISHNFPSTGSEETFQEICYLQVSAKDFLLSSTLRQIRVSTEMSHPECEVRKFSVSRSYKDFLLLHAKLLETLAEQCVIVPSPPPVCTGRKSLTQLGIGKGGRCNRILEGTDLNHMWSNGLLSKSRAWKY